MVGAHRAIVERRHSRDRARRTHAPVGIAPRRLQDAGADRGAARAPGRGRAGARGRRVPRDRPRGRPALRSPTRSRGGCRSRRSASARAPAATGRYSSTTTCSASPKGICRGSSSATRTSHARSEMRSKRTRPTCAAVRSRPTSTRTRCRPRSSRSSRPPGAPTLHRVGPPHALNLLERSGDRSGCARRRGGAECEGDAERSQRRPEVKALRERAPESGDGVRLPPDSIPSATTSSPSDAASRTIVSMNAAVDVASRAGRRRRPVRSSTCRSGTPGDVRARSGRCRSRPGRGRRQGRADRPSSRALPPGFA